MRHTRSFLLLCLVLMSAGCSVSRSDSDRWDSFVDSFIEDYFVAHPSYAVYQGRHEFDGQLPDWSRAGIDREVERLEAQRAMAGEISDLDERQSFERDYLISRIDRDLFWMRDARWPFKNPAFYLDWMSDNLDPNTYISRPYDDLDVRMAAFTKYARAVPRAVDQIQANLELPLPVTYIDFGVASFGGLASYYESDVPQAFSDVTNPELRAEFNEALGPAVSSMRSLAEWLESNRATATATYAIGSELFAKMVQMTEGVGVPIDELEKIERADMDRNLAALKDACSAFAPGKTLHQCVEKEAASKPEGGAVVGARNQLGALRAFLVDQNLVTIPGTEQALVEEAPPYMRSNSAYIDIPGPYETGLPSVYYISPPDPSWSPEDQLAYVPGQADLMFTSVHEVWPGHFLNFLHANRSASRFGQVFVGYAFGEGWAHYAEEMMWEAGFSNGDPEIHIGQLLNALLRNARFLSTIGLHTQGMSVAESENLFMNGAFQDRGNALQQAARGTYDPAYLNYNMGKLMIRKLRKDWTSERGGRAAWHDFHDTFLSFGGPPIPLVRRMMLGHQDDGVLF